MAGELQFSNPGLTGNTLYAVLFDATGQVYDDTNPGFEAWSDGSIGNYDIALVEDGTGGHYIGTMPSVVAGAYIYEVRRRAGASPAVSDSVVGLGALEWSGTAVVPLSSRLATSGYTAPDNATITTISTNVTTVLARLGSFTGTGVNTVLGFLRAMSNKVAGIATPSDLVSGGGTFINTTDSLEAIRDSSGSAAGAGAISWPITIRDGSNNLVDGAEVWITTTSDPGSQIIAGTLITDASGVVTFLLDAGTYYAHAQKSGVNFTATQIVVA